jgi:glutathione S-transferase
MLLIGMFDSPFVRRVAISMKLLGIPFEHGNWSVGKDFDRIRNYNPLGRVPTLVTNSGETLMESSAILDYLDELAGPDRALLPRSSLAVIDRYLGERGLAQWLVGKRMTQADITVVCAFTFLNDTLKVADDAVMFQSLVTLAGRCESLPAFQETRVPFFVPST